VSFESKKRSFLCKGYRTDKRAQEPPGMLLTALEVKISGEHTLIEARLVLEKLKLLLPHLVLDGLASVYFFKFIFRKELFKLAFVYQL